MKNEDNYLTRFIKTCYLYLTFPFIFEDVWWINTQNPLWWWATSELVCNSFVTLLTAQNDCSSPRTVRGDQLKDDVSDKYTTQWEN